MRSWKSFIVLCAVSCLVSVIAGCASFRVPAPRLFDAVPDTLSAPARVQQAAEEMIRESSDPVVGRQLLLRNDEVIRSFIAKAVNQPKRVDGNFDIGVSTLTACEVEWISNIFESSSSSLQQISGYCRSPFGRRAFVVSIDRSRDKISVTLGGRVGGDTFYRSPSFLRILQVAESPYVVAMDIDANADFREVLSSCTNRGGVVRGEIGFQWCATLYSDGGTACEASSECEGLCAAAPGPLGVCQSESLGPNECFTSASGAMSCP